MNKRQAAGLSSTWSLQSEADRAGVVHTYDTCILYLPYVSYTRTHSSTCAAAHSRQAADCSMNSIVFLNVYGYFKEVFSMYHALQSPHRLWWTFRPLMIRCTEPLILHRSTYFFILWSYMLDIGAKVGNRMWGQNPTPDHHQVPGTWLVPGIQEQWYSSTSSRNSEKANLQYVGLLLLYCCSWDWEI